MGSYASCGLTCFLLYWLNNENYKIIKQYQEPQLPSQAYKLLIIQDKCESVSTRLSKQNMDYPLYILPSTSLTKYLAILILQVLQLCLQAHTPSSQNPHLAIAKNKLRSSRKWAGGYFTLQKAKYFCFCLFNPLSNAAPLYSQQQSFIPLCGPRIQQLRRGLSSPRLFDVCCLLQKFKTKAERQWTGARDCYATTTAA